MMIGRITVVFVSHSHIAQVAGQILRLIDIDIVDRHGVNRCVDHCISSETTYS